MSATSGAELAGPVLSLIAALGGQTFCSIILAAVIWVLLRVYRGAPAGVRLALWTLVFVRLLVPAGWGHPYTVRAAVEKLQEAVLLPDRFDDPVSHAQDRTPNAGATAARSMLPAWQPGATARLAAAAIWLVGALCVFSRYVTRARAFRRLARTAAEVRGPAVVACVARWRARFRIRRRVRVVATREGVPPFTVGVLRPIIAVPASLLQAGDEAALEPVLAHELAHIRRLDALWVATEHWLRAAYFFNPAVWLAARQTELARECVCDGMVLAERSISPFQYGQALIAVLRAGVARHQAPVAGMSAAAREWTARLRNLTACRRASRWQRLKHSATAMAVALVVLPMGPPAPAVTVDAAVAVPTPSTASGHLREKGPTTPAPDHAPRVQTANLPLFRNPVPRGQLVAGFGYRLRPLDHTREYHAGVDLVAPAGTLVLAASDGTVELARDRVASRPGTVTISHGATCSTLYVNVEHLRVGAGEAVRAGQPIGGLESGAASTWRHLHFQILSGGKPIDPWPLIRRTR